METNKTNTIKEPEALDFVQDLVMLYFGQRDMGALPEYMEYRTSWIGTGDGELSRNLSEAKTALSGDITEYSGGFTVTKTDFNFMPLSDTGGVVYGTLNAVPHDKTLSEENMRLSVVLEQSETDLKLVHMHFSHADPAQEQGTYFVKENVRGDNQSLRQELNIRDYQLANLTKNIPGGAHKCVNDASLTLLSMSDGFLSMFGYTRDEIETEFEGKFINMVYPSDRKVLLKNIYAQLENGNDIEVEYRVLRKHGQPIWVLDKGRLSDDGSGNHCFYCVLLDITERKRQQEELRLSLERHQVIMDQATDIIFEWDIQKDTLKFSSNWIKKFGYDAIDVEISNRIPFSSNVHTDDMPAFLKLMKDTASGVPYSETEFRIRDKNDHFLWCRIRATAQYNSEGIPIKAVGVIVDIDEEKKQKQVLIAQAQHDTLTGIYNKATINVLVEQRMQVPPVLQNNKMDFQALFIIDVDHFKAVNDTFGHLSGDSVLSDVAVAIKNNTRSSDFVGRIGGDEFLIYLPDVTNEASAWQKAESILSAVSLIRPEPSAPPITCSIGGVVYPHTDIGYQTLYGYADLALYQRKNSGRAGATFWSSEGQSEPTAGISTSAVGNIIVSEEGIVSDEWLPQYTFRTLYEAKDIELTLNRLLEIIGRSFDVSRAYVFESSEDGKYCSNTFEWCGTGVEAQISTLQDIAYIDELGDYQKNFEQGGIFYCHDIKNLHPDVFAILEPQGIRSMLQCAMLDEGEFVGYVGFDECRENREWSKSQVAAFKLTADVLSTFLIKLRIKQRLNRS